MSAIHLATAERPGGDISEQVVYDERTPRPPPRRVSGLVTRVAGPLSLLDDRHRLDDHLLLGTALAGSTNGVEGGHHVEA